MKAKEHGAQVTSCWKSVVLPAACGIYDLAPDSAVRAFSEKGARCEVSIGTFVRSTDGSSGF